MRKLLIALLVAGMLGGAVYGAAATITVTSTNLGAGADDTVAACDTTVGVSYTVAWDATDNQYEVTEVKVTTDDDVCSGGEITVQLTTGGVAIAGASGTATVAADDGDADPAVTTVTIGTDPSAAAVDDVELAITNGS